MILRYFDCFHKKQKSSVPLHMKGTVMESFIYYLLGVNCFNPLPVHYYCTDCGYYEEIHTHLFGIDLPSKKCPQCGKDINSLYPDNLVIPWGVFQFESGFSSPDGHGQVIGISSAGYAVLPEGNTIQDYPALISYLENGEPCVTGGSWELSNHLLKPIRPYRQPNLGGILGNLGSFFSNLGGILQLILCIKIEIDAKSYLHITELRLMQSIFPHGFHQLRNAAALCLNQIHIGECMSKHAIFQPIIMDGNLPVLSQNECCAAQIGTHRRPASTTAHRTHVYQQTQHRFCL